MKKLNISRKSKKNYRRMCFFPINFGSLKGCCLESVCVVCSHQIWFSSFFDGKNVKRQEIFDFEQHLASKAPFDGQNTQQMCSNECFCFF